MREPNEFVDFERNGIKPSSPHRESHYRYKPGQGKPGRSTPGFKASCLCLHVVGCHQSIGKQAKYRQRPQIPRTYSMKQREARSTNESTRDGSTLQLHPRSSSSHTRFPCIHLRVVRWHAARTAVMVFSRGLIGTFRQGRLSILLRLDLSVARRTFPVDLNPSSCSVGIDCRSIWIPLDRAKHISLP